MRASILAVLALLGCPAPMVEFPVSRVVDLVDASVAVAEPDAGAITDAGTMPEPPPEQLRLPFGAIVDDDAGVIRFELFSASAERVSLELHRHGRDTIPFLTKTLDGDGGRWSITVPLAEVGGLEAPIFYGYRLWGPNWHFVEGFTPGSALGFVSDVDARGNRFNPNKLVFDPWALELSHDPKTPGAVDYPFNGGTDRLRDTGARAPKGIVLRAARGEVGARPTRVLSDDVIYEVHLRGLTMNDGALPQALRGTYAGAASRARALADLGVTAVEFLPVQETQNDTNDLDPLSVNGDNYWGYSTLAFFAPDRRYASDRSPGGPTREFQAMVRAFHDAGLKVFIDVVYNHTGEGGLLSFRGIDNPTYYSLTADRQGSWDNTGVNGNVNTRNSNTQTLIVESLRYWHEILGVDGYRFDLAPVLGNTCEHGCFRYDRDDPNTALNRIVRELPVRSASGGPGVDLIAEPWAIGAGTYQLTNFPRGWSAWNDQYRDAIRTHQNRLGFNELTLETLVKRLAGSADLFGGRPVSASINFVVAHDGFTVNDLVSCNGKNNGQAWPWGPSGGGSDSNLSWDQGGSAAAQRQAARTVMALLMLSAGTPMMTGGDEHLRTLRCNNNPYNLDSEKNWLTGMPTAEQRLFARFVSRLLAFRNAHPALRRPWPSSDGNGNGIEAARWFTTDARTADAAYLRNPANHALALRLDGSELGERDPILLVINGWSGPLDFTLPSAGAGRSWRVVGDTCAANEGPDQLAAPGMERTVADRFSVCGRGVAIMVGR